MKETKYKSNHHKKTKNIWGGARSEHRPLGFALISISCILVFSFYQRSALHTGTKISKQSDVLAIILFDWF